MLYSEEVLPLWAVAVGAAVPLVAVLIACICCRKTVPKASATANRSLPDIPIDSERIQLESGETLWESNEPNGDTSSELYATVEENKHVTQPQATRIAIGANQKCSLQDGLTDESKSSEHSSLSQTDYSVSPYAHLKAEHPYDKLRSEHPYAQVGANNVLDSTIYDLTLGYGNRQPSVPSEDSQSLHPSTSGDNTPRPLSCQAGTSTNPVPPPRTRKSSSHNSLLLAPSATILPGSVPNIQAATAIAGWVSANQELPYMTPPIPAPEMNPPQQEQVNFSGDSQDSKGYTSISVREPLANIKARTKVPNQRSRTQELVDSHYATVSDDSDEMYAAIDEPGQVYTSGSETYAQIQPLAFLEETPELASDSLQYPPQPPSVDSLKQVAQVHSRQASSSSAASSVANLGSPKPEKRQANSPLPPPPASSPDLYAVVDKKSSAGLAVSRNLEEMYAKVMKKKQRGVGPDMDQGRQPGTSLPEHADNLSHASIDTVSSHGSPELRSQQEPDGISACSSDHDPVVGLGSATRQLLPSYDVLHSSPSHQFLMPTDVVDPNYESLGGPSSIDTSYHDPGYEVVQQHLSDCDPNYEELWPQSRDSPATNLKVNFVHTDSVSHPVEASTNKNGQLEAPGRLGIDPGYEQVRSGANQIPKDSESGPHSIDRLDPGYEKVRSAVQEMSYMSVNKCGSLNQGAKHVADADYASVVTNNNAVQPDPGYEQVKSQNGSDWENHATNKHSNSSEDDFPGYDQVTLQDRCSGSFFSVLRDGDNQLTNSHPSYERVHSKGSSDADTYSGPEPDYASVDRKRDPEPNYESMSSEGQDMLSSTVDDPNYESVSYFDLPCDPPYERLHNEIRDSDGASSGYEKVKDHSDLSVGGPDEKQLKGSYLEPGYEEVGMRWDIINGDSAAGCNSSFSMESLLPESSCHLKEGNGNLCQPQLQTSPTKM
ncbi:uncharacterized protein LOC110828613 isoform X2 [Zootermopsis nevadensis]|uniref:uncharacterized protein LOC110828613 isoform X2 n=1 Tax=Zootermopsis nevadensis TaxID=136037 RepID=UPI000B8EA927|nr:uncharacterized protein LOC110828613 isoform X2 [Zootermopsis nevadensis]